MYHEFYQFKENPFNITADADFFFSSKYHHEAISSLMYGIEQRKGILVITGEVGTGKTTLCRKLLKQAKSHVKFGLILNPKFSELQLLQIVAHDFGIQLPKNNKNKFAIIQAFNEFLINETSKGHNIVLMIDEAQNLGVRELEQIRLLSNFETEKEKLLQILLVGQPELHEKLKLPALRQLRQRIAVFYDLLPLDQRDIQHYIEHRINLASKIANSKIEVSFTEQAIEKIFYFTQGTPRMINILCDRALLAGFVAEKRLIDDMMIETCAKEILSW